MSLRILRTAIDVDAGVLRAVVDCLDWFPDGTPMSEDDFIDRLCGTYGLQRDIDGEPHGWDIEDLGTPAVRKIMRHARAVRRGVA